MLPCQQWIELSSHHAGSSLILVYKLGHNHLKLHRVHAKSPPILGDVNVDKRTILERACAKEMTENYHMYQNNLSLKDALLTVEDSVIGPLLGHNELRRSATKM